MDWLSRLLCMLGSSKRRQKSAPEPIGSKEELVRFIFSSSYVNNKGAKPGAFMPASDGETSVFRKTRLGNGYPHLKQKIQSVRKLTLKGSALLRTSDVTGITIPGKKNLLVDPEETRYKWHANIIGWPTDKPTQKEFAIRLAQKSRLE